MEAAFFFADRKTGRGTASSPESGERRKFRNQERWRCCDLIQLFYGSIFAASLLCAVIYLFMWHKHFDVNFTMIFTLVPIACLGYLLLSFADTLDGAVISQKIVYIGGTFLHLFIVFSVLNLCQINLPRWGRTVMFAACAIVYASVLTIGQSDLFYRKLSLELENEQLVLIKEYGIMHTVFYALLCFFFLIGIITIAYSWVKKKDVPRRILLLLVIPYVVCMLAYFIVLKTFNSTLDLVPLSYVIAEIIYLMIAYRLNLYDISDTVIDSYVQEQKVGYVSFDFKYRYLGSNEVAKRLMPELADTAVDEIFGFQPSHAKLLYYLDSFKQNNENNTFSYTVPSADGNADEDRFYNVNVNYLYDGSRKRGYIVTLTDDTANKKYIQLLDNYNETLQQEVKAKTRHIVEMHDNLILSLATMVESRDNSTGGHIRRTSEGVRILTDEITKEGSLPLSPEFCQDVVKAAPMHDLGKIAVDDAVLRKPGRFTEEEYAKMKRHAAEGARVIHEILLNTDDESFKTVAENVAHYHHERWDGSGYPEGLREEQIPIEARIMAIADVYDALVSKRVYKEAYDFARADRIILEGMGTQFDPGLKSAYVKARPRLEAYYGSIG